MMGLISCYSELSVQVSEKTSCSNYKSVTNSVTPNSITPSIQTAVTNTYKTTLSTGDSHVITVTWCRNSTVQGLHITSGDDPTTGFKLNTSTRLFRKKRGNKTFEINNSKYEVVYDLSAAVYGAGAEPIEGYYVLIMVNSELVLFLGDMSEEAAVKKFKINKNIINSDVVSRREHFSGDSHFAAKFSGAGSWHDVLIRYNGDDDGVKNPSLSVCIDKRVVVRVKRLRWNFRGNQTIFVDGLQVDLMWDVHDWFFKSGSDSGSGSGTGYGSGLGSGSGSGSGRAVFLFRTRSGLDSRLWLEDEVKMKDEKQEFSLLVYANKS